MLQCTAVTRVPLSDTLTALITTADAPDTPPEDFSLDHYVLCELGEHDTSTEHAALLSPANPPDHPALWLYWTGTDTHRITTAPWCPATLHNLTTGTTLHCSLYDPHPTGHSWDITDPLGDLLVGPLTTDNTTDTTTDDPQGRPHP